MTGGRTSRGTRARSWWPEAVSDGLTTPCRDCDRIPDFDYKVTESFWAEWGNGPNVLCLPCLDRRTGGEGLADALVEVQWTGTWHTVVLTPTLRHLYDRATAPGARLIDNADVGADS